MCLPIILNVKNTISLQTFRKKNTARKQNRTNKKNVPPKLKQCITCLNNYLNSFFLSVYTVPYFLCTCSLSVDMVCSFY